MTDSDVRRIEDKVDNVGLVLAELKGSLSPTLERLTDKQDEQASSIDDHEKRLRALERFRFSVPSLALLSLVCSIALLAYYVIGRH